MKCKSLANRKIFAIILLTIITNKDLILWKEE